MPSDRLLTVRLPDALYGAALDAAAAQAVTPAEFVRRTLLERLDGRGDPPREVLPEQAVARDIADSRDWVELQQRLRARQLVLRRRDGEIWVCSWPIEHPLVRLDDLGMPESTLLVHYRARFPAYGTERAGRRHRTPFLAFFRRRRSVQATEADA